MSRCRNIFSIFLCTDCVLPFAVFPCDLFFGCVWDAHRLCPCSCFDKATACRKHVPFAHYVWSVHSIRSVFNANLCWLDAALFFGMMWKEISNCVSYQKLAVICSLFGFVDEFAAWSHAHVQTCMPFINSMLCQLNAFKPQIFESWCTSPCTVVSLSC